MVHLRAALLISAAGMFGPTAAEAVNIYSPLLACRLEHKAAVGTYRQILTLMNAQLELSDPTAKLETPQEQAIFFRANKGIIEICWFARTKICRLLYWL